MSAEAVNEGQPREIGFFERYLTVWVVLCIAAGIALGRAAPGFAEALDGLAISVNGAPVVSIPIAICLFCMMYPIMVKIDFAEVVKAGKSVKPVGLTLFINWAIKNLGVDEGPDGCPDQAERDYGAQSPRARDQQLRPLHRAVWGRHRRLRDADPERG